MTKESKRICLGAFAGAHGVKGETKIKSFTQSAKDIAAYGPVETEDGKRRFTLSIVRALKGDFVVARAPEINSREDAESLKGNRLYVDRSKLPAADDDEFYLEDLIGLDAFDENNEPMGAVNAVYNFGAGDVIELKNVPGLNGLHLVSFTKEHAPHIDIEGGRMTVQRAALSQNDENGDDQKEPGASEIFVKDAMRQEDS